MVKEGEKVVVHTYQNEQGQTVNVLAPEDPAERLGVGKRKIGGGRIGEPQSKPDVQFAEDFARQKKQAGEASTEAIEAESVDIPREL